MSGPTQDFDVLDIIRDNPDMTSSQIIAAFNGSLSKASLWRILKRLVEKGLVVSEGKARATTYKVSGAVAVRAYLQKPYYLRSPVNYDFEFVGSYIPNKTFYLSEKVRHQLRMAGTTPPNTPSHASTFAKRILEKLLVDLSWASSRMEGNTYDLLQTEALIRFGKEVDGKDRKETVMILNHKEAIQYVVENLDNIALRISDICNIHALLSDGLLIDPAASGRLRRQAVGISYSSYRPLDDSFSIASEFSKLIAKAEQITDPFEQSFFILLHIPYLQAFEDVNKRTARIVANIPLLKSAVAPLSFLTMKDQDYIDGLIGVYELQNTSLLKEVFVDAYLTSCERYKFVRAEVEVPEKSAYKYRPLVREIVRKTVRDCLVPSRESLKMEASLQGVDALDQDDFVTYVQTELATLTEENMIRYRLTKEELHRFRLQYKSTSR